MATERDEFRHLSELFTNESDLVSDSIERQIIVHRDAAAYAALCVELGCGTWIEHFPGHDRSVIPSAPVSVNMLDTTHRKLIKVHKDSAKTTPEIPNTLLTVDLSGVELDEINSHMLAVQRALLRVSNSQNQPIRDQESDVFVAGDKEITYKNARLHFIDINIAYIDAGGRPRIALIEQFGGTNKLGK